MTLPPHFVRKGWSQDEYDICWLACAFPGHRKTIAGKMEIVLCPGHILELERKTKDGQYAKAAPPDDQPHWERQEPVTEGSLMASQWPWERIRKVS